MNKKLVKLVGWSFGDLNISLTSLLLVSFNHSYRHTMFIYIHWLASPCPWLAFVLYNLIASFILNRAFHLCFCWQAWESFFSTYYRKRRTLCLFIYTFYVPFIYFLFNIGSIEYMLLSYIFPKYRCYLLLYLLSLHDTWCSNYTSSFLFDWWISILQINKRGETVDEKIKRLDAELSRYREQLKKTRPGPAQEAVKARAMRVLKQKRM